MREGKGFDVFGKSSVGEDMSTTALGEARDYLDALHDAEYRGRKDTDGAARYRLATRLGVKESYLFRLQYRAAEMKDVAGEVYRRLRLAYVEMCERNEKAAGAYRAERLELKEQRHAVHQKPDRSGVGEGAARD